MILQALASYYETLAEQQKVERPGWAKAKVSYGLELDSDGNLLRVIPLKREEQRGKKTEWVPQLLKVPEPVTRSSGISANFLCDHSGYFLGIDNKGKAERAIQCFLAAKKLHLDILNECDGETARAVKAFFEKWKPEEAQNCEQLQDSMEDILSGGNLVFWYHDKYAQEDKEIIQAWEKHRNPDADGEKRLCLVTGRHDRIARIHSTIKGIPGAQSSGAALVSFNAPAFESYEKEQSFNAPVGEHAMYAYTSALNYLISDQKHRTILGDTMIVYWSEGGDSRYQDIFAEMMDPKADTKDLLDGLFKNLKMGNAVDVSSILQELSPDERFYILGLAPNAARISVRFFFQDNFGSILNHIKSHYDRMAISKPKWESEYIGVWSMIQQTVNQKSREKKPIPGMAAATYRAVLSGEKYPAVLYSAVLGRIKAEQGDDKVTPKRAAIIKAYLIQNYKEDITVELNENNQNIAYILGREFAVLEAIQQDANPGINATIKDRYFNSACATPATIFPILFRLKNSHIRKISRPGTVIFYEKLLGELQSKIKVADGQAMACPKRLTLEEQGMFILGYYHQNQKRFEKKNEEGSDYVGNN